MSGSKATIDQKWEEYYLQDGQFRTSCRSRVIRQFWKQFVLCTAITGLIERRCTPCLWKQGCIKLIFRFSIRTKCRTSHQDWGKGQESLRSDKKDANDPLADLPFRLEDFTDSVEPTEKHAPAHSSRESDLELLVEVAIKSRKHSIYSHSPKDRSCDVCLRTNKDSLQKTHWRSSASSRKVW